MECFFSKKAKIFKLNNLFYYMKVLNVGDKKKSGVLFHQNDKKILSLLCYNVRLPLSKIARILNLSRQSVEYRIKSMEKYHLIPGSRTVINIKKLDSGIIQLHYKIKSSKA